MKNQKLSLNLGLALIIVASVMSAMVVRVNAGEDNALGTTPDSSSYSGSNSTTTEATSSNDSIQVENNGQITVSPTVQANVNAVASTVLNQVEINEAIGSTDGGNISNSNPNTDKTVGNGVDNGGENIDTAEVSSTTAVVAILVKGASTSAIIAEIKNIFITAGIPSVSVEALFNSIQGMIITPSASLSGVPVASNKSLVVAQNLKPSVDINKLNAAITAYNKIIMESDVKTLKKLAANPEFMAIRNILNQFRTALNSQ